MSFSKNSRDAEGTPFSCAKLEKIWKLNRGHVCMGASGLAQKHGIGILLKQRDGSERSFRQSTYPKG